MPSKNSIKLYTNNSYYHLYNRGVEKRLIFVDGQDYSVFLLYLKEYLLPKDEINLKERLTNPSIGYKEKEKINRLLRMNNFYNEITLIAYSLMKNHFHLFVYQISPFSIDKFMQSLFTRYTMYFNRKYKRVGSLFQSVYKAVLVESESQFIYLTKYIHQQSLGSQGETLEAKVVQPSSLPEYIKLRKSDWVHPEQVLKYFSNNNPSFSYANFMKIEEPEDFLLIQNIALDT